MVPFPENKATFCIDEVTAIICVRSHGQNPWVLERLRLLNGYYDPSPKFLIVDFGSAQEFAEIVRLECEKNGFSYHHIADYGTYAQSAARNIGFQASKTPLVFFTDIDFFLSRDAFSRMLHLANSLEIVKFKDTILTMPAFHLSERRTKEFFQIESLSAKDRFLERIAFRGIITEKGDDFNFIAPYSNNFLCHRDLFDRIGGYNEEFRGHGSEDFEFFIRYLAITNHFPEPENLFHDFFGPLKDSFYQAKPYSGFRRLLEVLTLPSEAAGLKSFHLWHPTINNTTWLNENDWKREKFKRVTSKYKHKRSSILSIDSLPREKTFLCCIKHEEHWRYFLPLRNAGIRTIPLTGDKPEELWDGIQMIETGKVNGIAIFNPYMKSHAGMRTIFEIAKKKNLETLVVERGALPKSIYYANDVSYNDPEFLELDLDVLDQPAEQIEMASKYIEALVKGEQTLETNNSFDSTIRRHFLLRKQRHQVVFLPLQIDDDMAVTQFTDGYESYSDFVSSIDSLAREFAELILVVKPHPLSKKVPLFSSENIVVCENDDNIHAMIEISNSVICYNSGVGLLAIAHQKTVFTIGNAYYLAKGKLAHPVKDLRHALTLASAKEQNAPSTDNINKFFAWLLNFKYSFFEASDVIRNFEERKSHDYKDISVEVLNVGGRHVKFNSSALEFPFSWKSYVTGRLGLTNKEGQAFKSTVAQNSKPTVAQNLKPKLMPKVRKLYRDPVAFFLDSKIFTALAKAKKTITNR